MTKPRPKLIFAISHVDRNTDTHHKHIYELIEHLAQRYQVFLLVESGPVATLPRHIAGYFVQPRRTSIARLLERVWVLVRLRSQGYRLFYSHYCEYTSLLASIVFGVTGGVSVRWICSQDSLYRSPLRLHRLPQIITRDIPLDGSIFLAHHLVTCTPAMKQYFMTTYHRPPAHVAVIPNFVDINKYMPPSLTEKQRAKHQKFNHSKTVFLYLHWLSERKGADRLITLAETCRAQFPNSFIAVVGNGPLATVLQQQIKEKKLSSFIHLYGGIPNTEVASWFAAADFLLMPSRVEEFGRVQIEAMAMGVPILTTQTESASFVLNQLQRGIVVPQDNFAQLITIGRQLITDQTRYSQLVKTGLHQVKKFTATKIFTEYTNFFDALVKGFLVGK